MTIDLYKKSQKMTVRNIPLSTVSTQPQAATHWLVRDLFKLTAEASASHLSSY
jgi:hypothetical protein